MKNNTLTQEIVRELFTYDGTNLFNRINRGPRAKAGQIAGSINSANGYRIVSINGKPYMATNIIHLYVFGTWPTNVINHLIRSSTDRKFFRPSTKSEAQYASKINKNNKTGTKGVFRKVSNRTGKVTFVARAGAQQRIYLGTFDTLIAAQNARIAFENKHHPEFISGKYPNGLPNISNTKVDKYINELAA